MAETVGAVELSCIHRASNVVETRNKFQQTHCMHLEASCVELGLCNLSLEFSLTHVVVAESSFG